LAEPFVQSFAACEQLLAKRNCRIGKRFGRRHIKNERVGDQWRCFGNCQPAFEAGNRAAADAQEKSELSLVQPSTFAAGLQPNGVCIEHDRISCTVTSDGAHLHSHMSIELGKVGDWRMCPGAIGACIAKLL